MSDDIQIHVQPALEGASLVASFEGWNDAGEAASHAVGYLAHAISAVPLAEIDGEEFLDFTVRRPESRIDEQGHRVVEWPAGLVGDDDSDAVRASAIELLLEGLHLSKRLNKDSVGGRASYRARA